MKYYYLLFFAALKFGLCASVAGGISYEDSIAAVLQNHLDPNDNSSGVAWFNATNYPLDHFGFEESGEYGIYTYTSLNYLTEVANLATYAASKGFYGDVVLLFYKFIYAGDKDNTAFNSSSDMVLDIGERLRNNKRDSSDLLDVLMNSSSCDEVKRVFELAADAPPLRIEKRASSITCDKRHQANKSDCYSLLHAIDADHSWKSGGPRHIQYRGCFVSWSKDATFQVRHLYNAGVSCYNVCATGNKVSCKARGVELNGHMVGQCLSDRAKGC
ncbi:hypothetical protein JA1_004456 [Spathaspora sp. JA1]|nr:hypothetical protein JA1_004456 [Spathaspora sp. JA1]